MTPKERAKKSAEVMWSRDKASVWFGFQIDDVDQGYAVLSLKVQERHTNGHGKCHGGVTFALADSAFAFACNSRNQSTVAQHNTITYTAPAKLDDKITATAREISLIGRNGIYDVEVINQDGLLIATFRGCSLTINGPIFEE